jgi:hypothetical protein
VLQALLPLFSSYKCSPEKLMEVRSGLRSLTAKLDIDAVCSAPQA